MVQQVITVSRRRVLPHCRRRRVERVCVWRCAKLCRAKGRGENEERVGTRACDLEGAWVIGWVGEPVVEGEDESVDDTCSFLGFALEPGVFGKDLWVCILLGW